MTAATELRVPTNEGISIESQPPPSLPTTPDHRSIIASVQTDLRIINDFVGSGNWRYITPENFPHLDQGALSIHRCEAMINRLLVCHRVLRVVSSYPPEIAQEAEEIQVYFSSYAENGKPDRWFALSSEEQIGIETAKRNGWVGVITIQNFPSLAALPIEDLLMLQIETHQARIRSLEDLIATNPKGDIFSDDPQAHMESTGNLRTILTYYLNERNKLILRRVQMMSASE